MSFISILFTFGILWYHFSSFFIIHVNVWLNSHSRSHSNEFVSRNSHSTNADFSWLRDITICAKFHFIRASIVALTHGEKLRTQSINQSPSLLDAPGSKAQALRNSEKLIQLLVGIDNNRTTDGITKPHTIEDTLSISVQSNPLKWIALSPHHSSVSTKMEHWLIQIISESHGTISCNHYRRPCWSNFDMHVGPDAGSRLQRWEDGTAVNEVTLLIQC